MVMAEALYEDGQYLHCLPAKCLIVKPREPVLTFLLSYKTLPHPLCHVRQVRQLAFFSVTNEKAKA